MQRTHFFMAIGLVATMAFSGAASADHDRHRNARGFNANGGHHNGGGAAVTLFTKDNFRGRAVNVNGAINLKQIGFNDKADSIVINQGSWVVCTKSDLGGRCKVLNRSVYDLDRIDLDDNISSIAPYNGGRLGNRRRW